MKHAIVLCLACIALLTACKQTKDTVRMKVASEKRTAMGAFPMDVLLVKEGDATEWSYFYSPIEGFQYEPGYEYVLEVKKETREKPMPQDASSIRYLLVKEVSKKQTSSENMPPNLVEPKE